MFLLKKSVGAIELPMERKSCKKTKDRFSSCKSVLARRVKLTYTLDSRMTGTPNIFHQASEVTNNLVTVTFTYLTQHLVSNTVWNTIQETGY